MKPKNADYLAAERPHILGDAIARLQLEQSRKLKPQGWFSIQNIEGKTTIIIHWPNRPNELIQCLSPGHANQVRQELSDKGLAGWIEGAA